MSTGPKPKQHDTNPAPHQGLVPDAPAGPTDDIEIQVSRAKAAFEKEVEAAGFMLEVETDGEAIYHRYPQGVGWDAHEGESITTSFRRESIGIGFANDAYLYG